MLGDDRKPFKTRSGETVKLIELLDEAVERAAAVIAEKNPDLDAETRAEVARQVGIGAVKYADLANDRVKDYVFDWDRMLSFDGNTAPYLQYAHARIRSIFRRARRRGRRRPGLGHIGEPAERALALQLVAFDEVVRATADSLQPHRLATYLFELAQAFTTFYEACPVLRADTPEQRASRLALCDLTARTLSRGLGLLGIEAPGPDVASAAMALAQARGATDIPLLDETIGANFEGTVARFPDREALVACHQGKRFTYTELNDAVDVVARGLLDLGIEKGDRVGIWSPNCSEWVLVQYATAKIGAILVNINPAYRTSEVAYALKQSGCRLLIAAPSFKTSDYAAMIDEVRPDCPDLERVILLGSPSGTRCWPAPTACPSSACASAARRCVVDDPINIQYTSGTTGFPKGATLSHHNILNNGYFIGRGLRLHRGGPGVHPGALLPLLRHGDGQPRLHHPRRLHGDPRGGLRPRGACSRRSRPSAARASTACRRCSSPSWRTPTSPSSTCQLAAHRDHGRVALPGRGDEAGDLASMHMDEVTICYGMTETSPVSTQTRRRRHHRQAGRHRSGGSIPTSR